MKSSPKFFENLVIELLVAMGYGGSIAPVWSDSPLALGMKSTRKVAGVSDDVQFLLNFRNEISANEESYRLCLDNQFSADAYLQFVGNQRLLK